MKTKLLLSAFFLCLAHASAFALVDANLYGGYTVGGEYKDSSVKYKDDFRWGASAHLNTSFLTLFQLGLGGYCQMSSVTYKVNPGDFTIDKTDIGIDAYAALSIPLIPLSPYIRGGHPRGTRPNLTAFQRRIILKNTMPAADFCLRCCRFP